MVNDLDFSKYPELGEVDKIIFPDDPGNVYSFKHNAYETDFREIGTLGSGKFMVKSYLYKPANRKMAVKFIRIPHNRYNADENNGRRVVELTREVMTFRKLFKAPNVVNCYGICLYEGQALICMEQMDMSLKEVYLKIHEVAE